ncbi:hypothetical protein ElyMa_003650300 [Elysia marginata]|uniref:Uncharacterized protein n=1 Tax=Elysia marginata TaxID=1093978 RepID=A0AAV4EXD3_9GAST|nr:hypothetical protein ElyMa_003650300 [Elysia marginata]
MATTSATRPVTSSNRHFPCAKPALWPSSKTLAQRLGDEATALYAQSMSRVHKWPEEHGEDGEELLGDVTRLLTQLAAAVDHGVTAWCFTTGKDDKQAQAQGSSDCWGH